MTEIRERADTPEDLARLFVERANAHDAVGLAELYALDAVLAYPAESSTLGREAICAAYERMLAHAPKFQIEEALTTVRYGDLALTSTRAIDNVGVRVQVARRQPDGTWLRIIDRPEIPRALGAAEAKEGALRVPGATLFYRVRGSGPLLLILCGGHGDADTTAALVDSLVDRYTVVTYDRRGLSRSTIDSPVESLDIAAHRDDAHRLLAALTREPALVFGSSIGAIIGLDLVAHHAEQVRVLVAHEPPAWELLPDQERESAERMQLDAEETFRREGSSAALKKFALLAAVDFDDREADVALQLPTSQGDANLSFFFNYDSPAVRRYRVDAAALRVASTKVVLAIGKSTSGSAPHHAAAALAATLGTEPVEFPGGHTAWLLRPKGFATKLREIT